MGELKRQDQIDEHFIKMDAVMSEYFKGKTPTEISKAIDMPLGTVNSFLREWRSLATNNAALKERAGEAVRHVDTHFSKLIKESYRLLEDAELASSLPQRANAIKLIADIEKTRIELLQKAGIIEDSDMGRKIAETERKQEILTNILKEVVGPCPHCRVKVQEALAQLTNDIIVVGPNE